MSNNLKVDRISAAYSKLRISGLTVDPSPGDLELALAELENMMCELASRGINIGYNFELNPDPNSDLGVPQQFWNMINTNLAVRLIADFNKQVPDSLLAQASQSLANASSRAAADAMQMVQYPSRQAVGSGNRVFARWARFYGGNSLPPSEPATKEIVQGETNDYFESFEAYLREGESITSCAIACDTGLVIVSSDNASPEIRYRLSAPESLTAGMWQQVRITIATTIGRVEITLINFEVTPYPRLGQT
jgi:hypothetical protein